jgi:hypothetical protein
MNERGNPPLETRPENPAPQNGATPFGGAIPAPARRRRRLAWAFSIAAHLLVFAALFWPYAGSPPPPTERPPIMVTLSQGQRPEPPGPPGPAGPPSPTPAQAVNPQPAMRPSPPHRSAPAPSEDSEPAPDNFSDILSESQLAVAASADGDGAGDGGGGGGGGGSGCDMARAVQRALQRDPLVRTAVEDAHRMGKSVMLWNGDWVRSGGQDGKGLSAVREAIVWELAFAPEACRNKRLHGLVLLSLADGSTRFAIGSGDWRWSDLLGVNGVSSNH